MQFSSLILGASLFVVAYAAVVPTVDDEPCAVDLKMPYKCSGKNICNEKPQNYPQKCIDTLLTKKYHLELAQPDEKGPVSRQGMDKFNDNDCPKEDLYSGPFYQIIDQENKTRVVVQSIHFNQTISTERCKAPGKRLQGKFKTEHFSPDHMRSNYYEIFSEQIKLDYNVLVLSHDGTRIEFAKCKDGVPVACTCRVRND